jgi:chaperonin cofactor prefoldin
MGFEKVPIEKLVELIEFSNKYEISIQFWPKQTAVYIAKDGVELKDFGGSSDFAIDQALDYLNRINPNQNTEFWIKQYKKLVREVDQQHNELNKEIQQLVKNNNDLKDKCEKLELELYNLKNGHTNI